MAIFYQLLVVCLLLVCDTKATSSVCSQPMEIGRCRARIPMYYFNKDSQQCEEFGYGGCGGNSNRFKDLKTCEATCGADICSLPKKAGLCFALLSRYYFNTTAGKCQQFNYGGCMGNENNFRSLDECKRRCDDECQCSCDD